MSKFSGCYSFWMISFCRAKKKCLFMLTFFFYYFNFFVSFWFNYCWTDKFLEPYCSLILSLYWDYSQSSHKCDQHLRVRPIFQYRFLAEKWEAPSCGAPLWSSTELRACRLSLGQFERWWYRYWNNFCKDIHQWFILLL